MNGERLDPALTTRLDIERPDPAIIEAARALPVATLHEAAGKIGVMPTAIKPTHSHFQLCGPAVTVDGPGGDNLWIHRAIYAAQPGDILVVNVNNQYDHGYWGEIMSTACRAHKLGGLVINGCVRDHGLLNEIGFPVFARGLSIRGTGKDFYARGWINYPTLFDDVIVSPGDLIVGDIDGVVCIPRERAAEVIKASQEREAMEADVLRRLENGETSLSIYGWE